MNVTPKSFNERRFCPSADQSGLNGFVKENGGSSTQQDAGISRGTCVNSDAVVSGSLNPKDNTVVNRIDPQLSESCIQQSPLRLSSEQSGLVDLDRLIIDLSIIEAIAEVDMDIAKSVEYDHEISDDGLLPLSRLEHVLSARDSDLPPIDIARSGSAYKIVNGRHRVARAFLFGRRNISTGHADFIRSGGESNPGPPKPVNRPTKQAGKSKIKNKIDKELSVFQDTRNYLRGRDCFYPDAMALARFNNWVEAHRANIDPQEQFFCNVCGHVGFDLCAHRITRVEIEIQEDEPVVDERLRHHQWSWPISKTIKRAFRWPALDTHSPHDEFIAGLSNEHLNQDLIITELFAYIVLHQQTSYLVNGREDRALKLAHSHRLAEKWLISSNKEKMAENDLHYSVRVRFTVQRACDNLQNSMLYEYRHAAWNFGWAWLPKSRVYLFLFLLLIIIGFVLSVSTLLSWVGTVLPAAWATADQTSNHRFGSMPKFTCVGHISCPRSNVMDHAYVVTQSCEFTDWATEQWNAGLCLFWAALSWISERYQTLRIGVCHDLRLAHLTLVGMDFLPEAVLQKMREVDGLSYHYKTSVLTLKSFLYSAYHC